MVIRRCTQPVDTQESNAIASRNPHLTRTDRTESDRRPPFGDDAAITALGDTEWDSDRADTTGRLRGIAFRQGSPVQQTLRKTGADSSHAPGMCQEQLKVDG